MLTIPLADLIIGDVVAFIATVLFYGGAAWGGMVLSSLFFPHLTQRGADRIQARPWRVAAGGFFLLTLGITLGIIFLNLPNGLLKLVGALILLGLLVAGIAGSGSVAQIAAQRVEITGGSSTKYLALLKGSGLVTAVCLMPIIGWLVIAPMVLMVSLGSFWAAFFGRSPQAVAETP